MKKYLNKILVVLILIITMFNMYVSPVVYATALDASEEEKLLNDEGEIFPLSGLVSLLLSPLKLLVMIPGQICNVIATVLGRTGNSDMNAPFITLADVLFNRLEITDINIMDENWRGEANSQTVISIRKNIAKWYVAIRNLAVILLLVILIYIGIRMAITTVAEDSAKYKKILMYWFTAIILVYMLHFIIIIATNINSALVSIMEKASIAAGSDLQTYNSTLRLKAWGWNNIISGIAAALVYSALNAATLIFLLVYIKRMITVSFLVLIAPIITITYPIDKIGDRKSTSIKYMA